MEVVIRPAKSEDAKKVAPLLIQAMEELMCKLTGKENPDDAVPLFEYFFAGKYNQYSYENAMVAEKDEKVAGIVLSYDGGRLIELRAPILEFISHNYGKVHLQLEPETGEGEYYIDVVSVAPSFQRRGYGKKLIAAAIERAKAEGHEKVGLLVELGNETAKRLYESLGFGSNGYKTIVGDKYEHLVKLL